jgi:F-type H+-transporting ATPase subunit b
MDTLKDILTQFGVEWPKFIAQVMLFVIVYFVLSKFAFKPIIAMLEERRRRIEEGQLNAEKIKQQLVESEKRYAEILSKANDEAQRLIDEARASSSTLAERRAQQAIGEAEQIIARAREATAIDREKMLADLKREVGRLVIDTTSKVTGKVLTPEDHRRLSEDVAREVTA